jgi:hypothetical protein
LGRLVLAGEEILDTTGAVPFGFHALSRLLWELLKADAEGKSDTKGTGRFRRNPERFVMPTAKTNHLQFLVFAASKNVRFDSIIPFLWRGQVWYTYLYYRLRYNTTCLYTDRMLGKNMSLDEGENSELLPSSSGTR